MSSNKRPITAAGYDALRRELQRLKAQRPEIANTIERARELGDLRENADYHEAKRHSGMVEAKIRDLEVKLSNAEIIDVEKLRRSTRVVFGVSVKLEDVDTGQGRVYTIVGEDESNIETGRISLESPIARALIGKEVGDIAKVVAPGGAKDYEVVEIFISEELWSVPVGGEDEVAGDATVGASK